jgi:ribonuclease BN (tRNA processing enzyme)
MALTLRLTFLGTGAPVPTAHRVQTGFLLETDGTCLLIDCGSGVLHRLAQSTAEFEEIANILLTHHHLDHIADLLPLMKTRWFVGEPSLEIAGPKGTKRLVNNLLDVHDYLREALDITVREVRLGDFSFANFDITSIETEHVMYCLGYRVTPAGENEPTFTFSGDSEAFTEMAAFASGSDIFVHDCATTDNGDESPHATPNELGEILAGHQFGQVYLTHLYPETDGHHSEMLESVRRHYDGDVQIPHDGLTIEMKQ